MADLQKTAQALRERGYTVTLFPSAAEAADYLDAAIDQTTVGFGGSGTVKSMGLFERLGSHNTVHWHWAQDAAIARTAAAGAEVYLCSANALAETGELVNIDGVGNRLASTLFGHRKVYFIVGRNKLTDTYDQALWRARNVAAPQRARQMGVKTPCAIQADRCYDCKSPQRICRGMAVLWAPMMGMDTEILLVDEDLGL